MRKSPKAPPPSPPPDERASPAIDVVSLAMSFDPDTTPVTLDGLRLLVNIAMVSCHQLKVQEEFFIGMLERATMVHTLVAKLEAAATVGSILHAWKDEEHPNGPETIDKAVEGILAQIRAIRRSICQKLLELAPVLEQPKKLS